MSKRILCLVLCVLMLVGCLAGCSSQTDDEAVDNINEEASESAMTLSMYLMSENKMSDEQIDAIETAVNKITKSKFKTRLELYFYTADEYYEKLEASFAARAEAEAAGLVKSSSDDETVEEETFENEWGVTEIKYPTIDSYQVDIFYMGGYEKFAKYLEMDMLSNLNDEITSSSKKLNTYIATPYLTYMKSINNKAIYAVPTNAAIGEYTYLLVSKKALEDSDYATDEGLALLSNGGLTGENVQRFLANIGDHGYTQLYFDSSKVDYVDLASAGIQYWGVDENGEFINDFSILASDVGEEAYFDSTGIFYDTKFKEQLSIINEYAYKGYFGDAEQFANGQVAMAYVKGGAEIPYIYEDDYETIVLERPTITTEDIYRNMFAVSSYTSSLSRSMEIVTYLNTNEEFRNLILYGIEGENYELVNSDYSNAEGEPYKVVKRLNENYMMDINKTGNTLITYSLEGENPALKEYIKEQNLKYKVSPLMGFNLSYDGYTVDMEKLETVRGLSADVRKQLNNFITSIAEEGKRDAEENNIDLERASAEFESLMTSVKDTVVSDNKKLIASLMSAAVPEDTDTKCALRALYEVWAEAQGIVPKDEG